MELSLTEVSPSRPLLVHWHWIQRQPFLVLWMKVPLWEWGTEPSKGVLVRITQIEGVYSTPPPAEPLHLLLVCLFAPDDFDPEPIHSASGLLVKVPTVALA